MLNKFQLLEINVADTLCLVSFKDVTCLASYTATRANTCSEADLRYLEHLCRRAKIALSLVFLR